MPAYQFHALPKAEAEPVTMMFFNDAPAIRQALGTQFPSGCDLWQGDRFVGRFHRAPASTPPT